MILLISTFAMPSPGVYETNDGQIDAEMQHMFKRSEEYPLWFYKRNSPLCDYRLQFRPLPLTSALCSYG
jgi:hypothetical protein